MKHRNKLFALAALVLSGTAQAAVIHVNHVDAYWSDVVGTATGEGTEELRWGVTSGEQSGFRFDASAPPAITVSTDTPFSLGDFTHFNFPIAVGTGIESARLNISALLDIGGTLVSEGPFNFQFDLEETINSCSPQPTCANDRVSFLNLATSDTFVVAGIAYTLELLGFHQGGSYTTDFSTQEYQRNTAQLVGVFRQPTVPVPEPGMLTLLGLGVLGLCARRRNRVR